MTTEIAIMNRSAIALAADSAVTIKTQAGEKVYNTVNKLFTLSKYQPVGVMIYGSSVLLNIPLETIVKEYRQQLGDKKLNALNDYAENFLKFLNNNKRIFPENAQKIQAIRILIGLYRSIKQNIDQLVEESIHKSKTDKISEKALKKIVRDIVGTSFTVLNEAKTLSTVQKNLTGSILKKYDSEISRAIKHVFQKLPLTKTSISKLKKIGADFFVKELEAPFPTETGVVISGYGEKETFPSLISYTIRTVIANKLIYSIHSSGAVDFENGSFVQTFAQGDMVTTFMEGVDPIYDLQLDGFLGNLINTLPKHFVKNIIKLTDKEKDALRKNLAKVCEKTMLDLRESLNKYKKKYHIDPITSAVAVLPKDELAAMAESLIHLTSLKRKVSMEIETVGGPIDVAVISKGEGFIWIKRKFYFKPELNAHFFANYFKL